MTSLDDWRTVTADAPFEETLQALNEVIGYLQGGGLTLDEAVSAYQVGVDLTLRCEQLLNDAQIRISRIEDNLTSATMDSSVIADAGPITDDGEDV